MTTRRWRSFWVTHLRGSLCLRRLFYRYFQLNILNLSCSQHNIYFMNEYFIFFFGKHPIYLKRFSSCSILCRVPGNISMPKASWFPKVIPYERQRKDKRGEPCRECFKNCFIVFYLCLSLPFHSIMVG